MGFSKDGRTLATYYDGVWLWPVPGPLEGTPERLRLWVEWLTGLELDARGGLQELDDPSRQRIRQRLDELGGEPDEARGG